MGGALLLAVCLFLRQASGVQSRQFEREPLDFKKRFGQTRRIGIKAGTWMLQHSIASGVDP